MKKKYPTTRRKFCHIVGETRQNNIAEILSEYGKIQNNPLLSNGVDLLGFNDKNQVVLAIEITNYAPGSYCCFRQIQNKIRNLMKYPKAFKVLVYSFDQNFHTNMKFINSDIYLFEVGYQTLPPKFFYFYNEPTYAKTTESSKKWLVNMFYRFLKKYDVIFLEKTVKVKHNGVNYPFDIYRFK